MDYETPEDTSKLLPYRHQQHDLFVCDVADAILKDDMGSMEHPFFSLSKKPETSIRRYDNGDRWVEVVPSVKGLATIYDKDILIYCISQLIAKINEGGVPSPYVKIVAKDLLVFVNRSIGGKDYDALFDALQRLDGSVRPTDRVLDSRGPMSSERRASSWPTANRAIRAKNNTGDA